MKRTMIFPLAAAILILGLVWVLPHSVFSLRVETPTPQSAPGTVLSPTPLPAEVVSPAPAEPQVIRAVYENISFVIPVGLAGEVEAARLPASEGPLTPSPSFVEFRLKGYPFPDPGGSYQPRVRIYPAQEYASLSIWAGESINRLENTLVGSSAVGTNDSLPNVPYMGSAAQLYAAQVKRLAFKSGAGVRMISAYAQYPASIGQHGSSYHYEGLSWDGKYVVVVEMPLTLPVYADESNAGENGITYLRQDWMYMQSYYQAVTDLLNNADPDGFNPLLRQLDALVQSIAIEGSPALVASQAPCLQPAPGTSLLRSEEGYCLLYPSQYSTNVRRFIAINPAKGPGDVVGDAWAFIETEDAAGRTAAQVADEKIAAAGQGFNITRLEIVLDGEQAIVVDGLPGQDPMRNVFVVHQGRLYTLNFAPWKMSVITSGMGQRTPLEHLYAMIMQSFRFLQ